MMRRRNIEGRRAEDTKRLREELFKQALTRKSIGARHRQQYDRQGDAMRNKAEKTTEMLNSLVQRMNEQVMQQLKYDYWPLIG